MIVIFLLEVHLDRFCQMLYSVSSIIYLQRSMLLYYLQRRFEVNSRSVNLATLGFHYILTANFYLHFINCLDLLYT